MTVLLLLLDTIIGMSGSEFFSPSFCWSVGMSILVLEDIVGNSLLLLRVLLLFDFELSLSMGLSLLLIGVLELPSP